MSLNATDSAKTVALRGWVGKQAKGWYAALGLYARRDVACNCLLYLRCT